MCDDGRGAKFKSAEGLQLGDQEKSERARKREKQCNWGKRKRGRGKGGCTRRDGEREKDESYSG